MIRTPLPFALLGLVPSAVLAQHVAPAPVLRGPAWTHDGGQPSAGTDAVVAAAGDVDGDGFDDVLVGMPRYDGARTDSGLVLLFRGTAGGLQSFPGWSFERAELKGWVGASVASAGDVNGDGFDDVLVGAPLHDVHRRSKLGTLDEGPAPATPSVNAGAAFLFLGSPSGPSLQPDWTILGPGPGAFLGASVAGARDVNADGFDDVLVGLPGGRGEARVYLGSPAGLWSTFAWRVQGPQLLGFFGAAVSAAGDVDGDGFDDVLVGAWGVDVGAPDVGQAWLFRGRPAGPDPQAAWTYAGNEAFLHLGQGLAPAGDVDGDGFDDVLVGAPSPPPAQGLARFLFFRGGSAGLELTPSWSRLGTSGAAVAGGDVDGDGHSDVILGDPALRQVALYRGTPSGPEAALAWLDVPPTAIAFGAALAFVGDVDQDGLGDVVAVDPSAAGGSTGEGRASLYLGSIERLLPDAPAWTGTGFGASQLGNDIARAGDADGDGYDDVLIGDGTNVLVVHGSASGPESGARTTLVEPPQPRSPYASLFPYAIDGGFDANGDGYDDVAVGAPSASTYQPYVTFFGRVYVYPGTPTGIAAQPGWSAAGAGNGTRLGADLAALGDLDGDGFLELGVIESGTNQIPIFAGSPQGPGASPRWRLNGLRISAAGDVNGDGFADALVSTQLRSELYYGSALGIAVANPGWTLSSSDAWVAGDLDGDGFDDFLASCGPFVLPGTCVYYGSPQGPVANTAAPFLYSQPWNMFSFLPGGDVNGDGFGELLGVGPTFANGTSNEGVLALFEGGVSGPSRFPGWRWESDVSIGISVGASRSAAAAVDVDADGYADLVVGSRFTTPGGEVFAFRGGP